MTSVAGYELLGRVGEGSAATVWKAHDRDLDRLVALKELDASTDEQRARWQAEARVLAALDDTHVVRVYGYAESETHAYIVQEWIDGATLAAVLAHHGRLTPAQALGVVRGALLGLGHAHDRGVVHGDVKPSNILVGIDGVSHLIDFGLATTSGAPGSSGSPAFRSPEAEAGGVLTPASDVYSAARMLCLMLTGDASRSPQDAIGEVLEVALAADPEDRYRDARAFLEALSAASERTYGAQWWTEAGLSALVAAAAAGVVAGSTSALLPVRRRWGKGRIAAGSGAAVVAAVVVVVLTQHQGSPQPQSASAPVAGDPAKQAQLNKATGGTGPTSTLSPAEVINGQYHVTGTVTSVTGVVYGPDGKRVVVGSEVAAVDWTVQANCDTETHCGGTMMSSSGRKYKLEFTGRSWLAISDNEVVPCHGATGTNTVMRAVVITPPSGVTSQPGELRAQQQVTTSGSCSGTATRSQGDLVMTRTS